MGSSKVLRNQASVYDCCVTLFFVAQVWEASNAEEYVCTECCIKSEPVGYL